MKNSIVCAVVALVAIAALFGMFLAIRNSYKNSKHIESIVRKRIEEQNAAFQKIDSELFGENRNNKIVAKIGTDIWDVDETSKLSA